MTNWNGKSRKFYIKTRVSLISFMTKFLKWFLLHTYISMQKISVYKDWMEDSRGGTSWKFINLSRVELTDFRIESSSNSNFQLNWVELLFLSIFWWFFKVVEEYWKIIRTGLKLRQKWSGTCSIIGRSLAGQLIGAQLIGVN